MRLKILSLFYIFLCFGSYTILRVLFYKENVTTFRKFRKNRPDDLNVKMTDLIGGILNQLSTLLPTKEVQTVVVKEVQDMSLSQGRNFIRIAGLSGGLAVIMSAYGAHAFNSQNEDTRLKNVFESGSKMHLIHSVALLAVPLTRRPMLVGSLMTSGLLLFSGTCYYQAITGDGRVRKATPYGGILLILSWLAMIL